MRKSMIIWILGGLAAACLLGLLITGWQIGWGPFKGLFKGYGNQVSEIAEKYDANTRKGEIVFYGASNFRLWIEMEADLEPYPVQNHGFGGSTDKMLVQYADQILYPYEPKIVFFQTGSNDYVVETGTEEEKIQKCMDYKVYMFNLFHEKMPRARFVIMSGLLLPGRSEYTDLTKEVNRRLAILCEENDYMSFVDAEALTFDGENYKTELFIKDGIHLNHEGQLLWAENYILPQLKELWEE